MEGCLLYVVRRKGLEFTFQQGERDWEDRN